MKHDLQTYALFIYEIFGGEVNDRWLQSGGVEINPTWEDKKILRKVKAQWGPFSGLKISDLSDDTVLYLEDKNGNPIGELVPADMVCQPWTR